MGPNMQMREQTRKREPSAPRDAPAETPEVLFFRYHAYRRRQAARLLYVMPREAVRELYGKAREWAKERGLHDTRDPMATLIRFAEHILPLPPLEVWLADRQRNPLHHMEDVGEGPHTAIAARPSKLEDRRFEYGGRQWIASLNVFLDGGMWRGFLRFREPGRTRWHHTANIFLEETATEVRERFREFDGATLGAFLRSVIP